MFDEASDDECCGQHREGETDVGPSLVTDGEAGELGEPSQRPLDDPPVPSQSLAALDPAPRDAVLDATVGERLTAAAVIVSLVGMLAGAVGPPYRSAGFSLMWQLVMTAARLLEGLLPGSQ